MKLNATDVKRTRGVSGREKEREDLTECIPGTLGT